MGLGISSGVACSAVAGVASPASTQAAAASSVASVIAGGGPVPPPADLAQQLLRQLRDQFLRYSAHVVCQRRKRKERKRDVVLWVEEKGRDSLFTGKCWVDLVACTSVRRGECAVIRVVAEVFFEPAGRPRGLGRGGAASLVLGCEGCLRSAVCDQCSLVRSSTENLRGSLHHQVSFPRSISLAR